MPDNLLWYREPAERWIEALPLGNGRLGAMVFGGPGHELYQLNEDTLWTGGPYRPVNPAARAAWPRVRELVLQRAFSEAEALIQQSMMAIPLTQMSFQPAGDLRIATGHDAGVSNYRRELDIARALATVTYEHGGATFRRESFISAVDQMLAIRFSTDGPAPLELEVQLTSEQPGTTTATEQGTLHFAGTNRAAQGIDARLDFAMHAEAHGRTVAASPDGTLLVSGGKTVTILLDIATSFVAFDEVSADCEARLAERRQARAGKSWDELFDAHVADYRRLFDRFGIDLGTTDQAAKPTPTRIAEFAGADDPALASLYVQFGRYLMACSSRPGTQPSTLQGIWNNQIDPPWGSKYTTNINLEMNYWLPDPANLTECFEPLIGMAEDLMVTGAEMARAHYDARGWVLHHNTDLWRAAGPIDGAPWGMWPTGGAWLAVQLWDHAAFAGDDPALVRRLYPIISGAARFILDYLTEDPETGNLVTNPSNSPENRHPFGTTVCAGPAMDNQIIRDLFDVVTAAATQLDVDDDLVAEMHTARARLAPDRIGAHGQLQEWREDWDLDAPERHHRHVSHLYALYPSFQINPDETPDLVRAAQRTLEIRGDEATGWGIGWRLNLWARLRDGAHAHDVLALLLSPERSYPNLFDAHPPFQIDGNFGGAAGIIEMLIQSRPGRIHLLPALPPQWPAGRLTGVRARGGITLDFEWSDARIVACTLTAPRPTEVTLIANGDRHEVSIGQANVPASLF